MTFWNTLKDNPKQRRDDTSHIYYPSLSSKLSTENLWMEGCLHERNRLMKVKSKGEKKHVKSPYQITFKRKNRVAARQSIQLPLLSEYLKVSRIESMASIVIQSLWRRYQAILMAKRFRDQKLAVIVMQAFVRGFTKKRWYAKWKADIIYYATRCQARRRQIVISKKWEIQCLLEWYAITKIQAVIRTFLAKCEFMLLVRSKCATAIQAFWRGWIGREVASKVLLDVMATKIQCKMRRYRAEQSVVQLGIEYNLSSLTIQNCWRGFIARKLRNKILFDRHNDNCRRQIMVWTTEIEHYKKSLENLLKIEEDNKKLDQLEEIERRIHESSLALKASERNIEELMRSKSQVTPEMVSQGWEDEIIKGIKDERQMITDLKLELLLNMGYHYEKRKRQRHKLRDSKSFLENKVSELQELRQRLVNSIQLEEKELIKRTEMKTKRMAIADEKRKWRVEYRHPNGKPMRASGTENISSRKQSYAFCSGNINIIQQASPKFDIIERIKLQSHLNELNMLNQAFMDPISRMRGH